MSSSGVVILTGAGVSADSGVATFRDAGGLWAGHRPEDVATPQAWAADPRLVWRFYQERRAALASVEPNAAHHGIADFERRCASAGRPFTLVSQNVDDLHQRAGSTVVEMHGQLRRLRCERCGDVVVDSESVDPARFVACGACDWPRLRPDVVWFGELPQRLDAIERALASCSLFVCIGTSGAVYPAAGLLAEARAGGARTIVNALDEPDNLHPADEFHRGRARDLVPPLLAALGDELDLPRV